MCCKAILVFLPGDLPEFRPLPWARPLEVPTASSRPGCKGHAAQHKQLGNLASVPGVLLLLLGDYLHQRLRGQVASQIEECPAIFICRPCLGSLTLLGTHGTSTTAGSCRPKLAPCTNLFPPVRCEHEPLSWERRQAGQGCLWVDARAHQPSYPGV